MTERRRKPKIATPATLVIALGASAAAALVAGAIAGFTTAAGLGGAVVVALTVAVLLVATFAICVWWWNHLDEAAREAHKWAWWWGGNAGTAIGGISMAVMINPGVNGELPGALGALDPAVTLNLGLFSILGCQLVGYGVAWVVWWLRRR